MPKDSNRLGLRGLIVGVAAAVIAAGLQQFIYHMPLTMPPKPSMLRVITGGVAIGVLAVGIACVLVFRTSLAVREQSMNWVRGGRVFSCTAVLLCIAAFSLLFIAWRDLRAWRWRVEDMRNLKSIASVCLMYSGEHGGQFPSSLAEITVEDYGLFIPIYGQNTASPLSYIYTGYGMSDSLEDADRKVLVRSGASRALGTWFSFLFVDGHVEGHRCRNPDNLIREKGWIVGKKPAETRTPQPE